MKNILFFLFILIFLSCSLDENDEGYTKEDDIQFLNDIIELNNLSEETTPLDNDNGDGDFTALELGWKQKWENDRLTYLDLAGWIPGDQDSSIYNIKVIPASIEKADKIKYLTIHNSDLSEIPEEILHHPSMLNLHLALNKIKEIPEGIYNMKNLETISLFGNELTTVPTSISKCPKLENLILTANQIKELSYTIWDIPNLKDLSVNINQLTQLPDSIDKIEVFEYLNFSDNNISYLPSGFENIRVIYGLSLFGNSLFCSGGHVDSSLVPEYLYLNNFSDPYGSRQIFDQNCNND